MGIRKVLGASISGLVLLISKDFARLVLVAFVFAAPLAWWYLNGFLKQYDYRIEMGFWVFAGVGAFALMLTVLIVSTQALKAALANPTRV